MCECSRLTYCFGNIIYIFEKLVSCCAFTSVVTCLVVTIIVMLTLGIGLGYNYCYIDMETGRYKDDLVKPVETHEATTTKGISIVQPMTTMTPFPIEVNATMVAPLNIGINFTYLIQRIKEKKQNVTLELIL